MHTDSGMTGISLSGYMPYMTVASLEMSDEPDILQQILSESMVLTTVAGMAGISFAVFILHILESATNEPGATETHYQVSFGLAIGTCALLIALGVLAGLAPAYRAMAIKPIEAIRDE